jgi:excisionase family DNA binding protein
MNQLHEVSEVAKILKCNKNTVYALIKSGQLRGLKLGRMKVSTFELDAFMQRNTGKDITDPYNVRDLEVVINDDDNWRNA